MRFVRERDGDQYDAGAAVVHAEGEGEGERGGGGRVQPQQPRRAPADHERQPADQCRHDQSDTQHQWTWPGDEGAEGAAGVDVRQDQRAGQGRRRDCAQYSDEQGRGQSEADQNARRAGTAVW
ncbi:hypothetical protein ACFC8N_26755 [Streptomyces sp. NPDC055966]|uniref:hypothetical protein n=1 Tax=Streptomyces sp. NPDC055966 TaxID=3345669 RepID=UPI0035DE8B84